MTVTPAVLAGLEVTPTSLQMLIGFNGQFIATGLFSDGSKRDITTTAEWQSLNPSLVSSGAGKGNVVPKAVGSTAIVAKMGRFTGTAPISVSAVIAAPTAPSHVTIKQRDDAGQITLSWPVVPGATSYNVYVYDSRSSSFSTVTYHASSPYTKTFKAGTYHFIVTAVNSFGESAPSSWISAQK